MFRIDVFSAKGGVGKTTVAYRLATEASKTGTVLLVDADLTGTCLGDLIEPSVTPGWSEQTNLTGLICGGPENLPEQIGTEKIPVFEVDASLLLTNPTRVHSGTSEKTILFCPSHPETYVDVDGKCAAVDPAVLHALLGHESAGGWVRYVINEVINATDRLLGEKLDVVIVDHGPGIGALQWAEMNAIEKARKEALDEKGPPQRQALFVSSRDTVDLAACKAINERMKAAKMEMTEHAVWVINRAPSIDRSLWRKPIEENLQRSGIGPATTDSWFARAFPLFEEPAMGNAYAKAELVGHCHGRPDEHITAIYNRLRRVSAPSAVKP